MVRFGKFLNKNSLACLGSWVQDSRAGQPLGLSENSLQNLLHVLFGHSRLSSLLMVESSLEGDAAAALAAAGDAAADLVIGVGWVSLHDVKDGGAGNILWRGFKIVK